MLRDLGGINAIMLVSDAAFEVSGTLQSSSCVI